MESTKKAMCVCETIRLAVCTTVFQGAPAAAFCGGRHNHAQAHAGGLRVDHTDRARTVQKGIPRH